MTNEELDLIRMADKAGFDTCRGDGWPDERLLPKIKKFSALLRDRMISEGWRQCAQGQRVTQHCAVAEQARQEEREACAIAGGAAADAGLDVAAEIRARGQA